MAKMIAYMGCLLLLSGVAYGKTSPIKVPLIPACAKKCCTAEGEQGGTRQTCQQYCHKVYKPYTAEGTPVFQVSMLSSPQSPIRRLSECKNNCSRSCYN